MEQGEKSASFETHEAYELGCVWQARRTAISFDIKSSYEGAICSAEYEFCRIGILVVPLAGHVELDIER